MVNSGEFGTRNDGATPISNRRALSDDVTNFPSIDYSGLYQIQVKLNRDNKCQNLPICNIIKKRKLELMKLEN
ncbi:MAG: palindromic element RPE2 domain-containing protein [Rickettsia endosymbiont of Culicoides impunctatus]|nr:MAG: palindromic element RPE2 domain-containing protein [Rickettsia endosymbiont of Culicoides impunctatus]